jgi:hypothetical protein
MKLHETALPRLLDQLRGMVDEATPLNPESYPALVELTGQNAEAFKIGHSLRHLSSSVGDMQELIENAEHGGKIDYDVMIKKISSATFSLLKLMSVTKASPTVVIQRVVAMAEKEKAR